jgi:hypothetical protein
MLGWLVDAGDRQRQDANAAMVRPLGASAVWPRASAQLRAGICVGCSQHPSLAARCLPERRT